MRVAFASLIALALVGQAYAAPRRKRPAHRPACLTQIWSPDTGPQCFGPPQPR